MTRMTQGRKERTTARAISDDVPLVKGMDRFATTNDSIGRTNITQQIIVLLSMSKRKQRGSGRPTHTAWTDAVLFR